MARANYIILLQINLEEAEVETIAKAHLFTGKGIKWRKAILELINDERANSLTLELEKQ